VYGIMPRDQRRGDRDEQEKEHDTRTAPGPRITS